MTLSSAWAWLLAYGPHVFALIAALAYVSYNVLPRGDPPPGGWRLALWLAREFVMVLSRYETVGPTKPLGVAEMTPAATMRALAPVPVTFPPRPPTTPSLVVVPPPAPLPRDTAPSLPPPTPRS